VRGAVESLLATLGVKLAPVAESHLCCGSAGTYSVTQPNSHVSCGTASSPTCRPAHRR
jgi:Fe-S oxidoreductase